MPFGGGSGGCRGSGICHLGIKGLRVGMESYNKAWTGGKLSYLLGLDVISLISKGCHWIESPYAENGLVIRFHE